MSSLSWTVWLLVMGMGRVASIQVRRISTSKTLKLLAFGPTPLERSRFGQLREADRRWSGHLFVLSLVVASAIFFVIR